jgi:hypothetical protein
MGWSFTTRLSILALAAVSVSSTWTGAASRPPIVSMLDLALQRFAEFQDRNTMAPSEPEPAGRAPASISSPSYLLYTGERESAESCRREPASQALVEDHLQSAEPTYDTLRSLTEGLSGRECLQVLRWELNRPGRLWSELGMVERADRIRAHAVRTFRKLVAIQKATRNLKGSGDAQKDIYNPDYLDPILSPELVTCVALQETKGFADLSPHAVNYTFCLANGAGKYSSSASGLGQMTWTTMSGVSAVMVRPNEAPAELLPIKTVPRHEGKSIDELFAAMNDDVPLQMEVIYRVMNYKLKFARFKYPDLSGRPDGLIRAGVASYDRDDQSDYLKNVVQSCMPCMAKRRKGTILCLDQMKH